MSARKSASAIFVCDLEPSQALRKASRNQALGGWQSLFQVFSALVLPLCLLISQREHAVGVLLTTPRLETLGQTQRVDNQVLPIPEIYQTAADNSRPNREKPPRKSKI